MFEFDAALSELPQELVEKIYSFDSMEIENFLEFAYDRVLAIASDPADSRRLCRCIPKNSDDPKVRRLNTLCSAAPGL